MSRIKKYCITNGTVNRVQQNLYEGGYIPGKADIAYAVKEAIDIMQRGKMGDYQSFNYAGSYSGFFYDSLFCYGKTMFQNANGRDILCSQLLICAWEDVEDGAVFLEEVIRFPYLSLNELLESGTYKKNQVFDRETDNSPMVPLNNLQKGNIAKAVSILMQEKNVVIQLPNSEDFEALSLSVLYEAFRILPSRDRREISFSTARNANDIVRLKGRIRLIITNENQPGIGDGEWIRLNDPGFSSAEQGIISLWQSEDELTRKDIEENYFLAIAEERHRSLKKDYQGLEKLYCEESYWWNQPNNERYLDTFEEVFEEYRNNPALAIQTNRSKYFTKIRYLLNTNNSGEDSPEKNLISLLLDYLYEEKIATRKGPVHEMEINNFMDNCQTEFYWFGLDESWIEVLSKEIALLKQIFNIGKTV